MKEVVIAGGIRSPFVKAGTLYKDISAYELGAIVLKELIYRSGIDPLLIDEVIIGNVANPAEAMNIARVIALLAGLPEEIPALTVHRNCSSGMQSITTAYDKIKAGTAEIVVAGGVESMSNIPFYFRKELKNKYIEIARGKTVKNKVKSVLSIKPIDLAPIVGITVGLSDPVSGLNMGQTAEILAKDFKITRKMQDEFALWSHQKAIHAIKNEILQKEIMPLYIPPQYKIAQTVDNGPREDTSMEALGKLKKIFDKLNGTITAGNSSQVTDGACMVIVTTREKANELGLEIMGTLSSYAYAGLDPRRMGLGPVYSTYKLLSKEKIPFNKIQLIEINEAFAAQVIANEIAFKSREYFNAHFGGAEPLGEIDRNILNVNGGAIALGHPVGATGSRMVLTLLKEMERRNLETGLATLCIGGGQGAALLLERK